MTAYQIAYLVMAISGWLLFAVVLMWATHRTNPAPRKQVAHTYVPGLDAAAGAHPSAR